MNISEVCIKRPVFATVLSLIIVLFGVMAMRNLPVRELPDIDPPIVSVVTVYPGANAELIETEVTEILEQELNNISGIKTLRSESRAEVSQITVEFQLNHDVDIGSQDVRDRISRVREKLPDDIKEPIVSKQDANAEEIMWIVFYGDRYSTLELTTIAETQVKEQLQTVNGVGGINLGGAKRFAIRLWLDADKMASRGVTPMDIKNILQAENVELPSGRVENLSRESTILVRGKMDKPDEYENLIIRYENGAPIRLRDVARAEVGSEDERTIARYNGRPTVGLGIVKQSDANTVDVARKVKAEMRRIQKDLPEGITVDVAYDSSIYIEKAIHEVRDTIFISFFLVVGIIFFFLRNVRSTLIPATAIPVSIVGTFAVLDMMGYSINILTLLALVLAIGVVVDDAIVVLENVYRHMEEGMDAYSASIKGMKEITLAVIVITISLVAVFLPIAFQKGTTGVLFREFAITVSGSVIISAFVALTLTPVLCAVFLYVPKQHGKIFLFFEDFFNGMAAFYAGTLAWATRHKILVSFIGLMTIAASLGLYKALPKEFLPQEDKGYIICIVIAPEGSTSEYTDRFMKQTESIAESIPEKESYFSAVALSFAGGPGRANQGLMFVKLKEDRDRSAQAILRPGGIDSMFARMFNEVKGAISIGFLPKALNRGFGETFQLVLQCQDLKLLDNAARKIQTRLMKEGFLGQPNVDFNYEKPQINIEIDRDKASAAGVSVRDISETMQIFLGGQEISQFNKSGKQYVVIGQMERSKRLTPQDIERLHVRTQNGQLVQLRGLIRQNEAGAVNTIYHFQRFRSAKVTGEPQGVTLGEAMDRVKKILKEELPPGVMYTWDGEAREVESATTEGGEILILALLIIFLVLAAQFESFMHPITVMLAVPLATFGGLLLLFILNIVNNFASIKFYAPLESLPAFLQFITTHLPEIASMNMNLYSLIGFVLLLGLVTKNSILLVEFANQRVAEGMDATKAMIEAGRIRFRPILMTALSTMIGILPIAIGMGAGGESRRPLGVAVIGGMLTSTFLTLYIVPVVYILLDKIRFRKRKTR
ncbi:MAG: efflux RND transporter permease subunit [Verrucomicrobiota bacterium]